MSLPQYLQQSSASPKFKVLVAHPQKSSDPSKGEAGNPTMIRRGFEMQVISTHRRNGSLGLVEPQRMPSLIIKVNSADYFNEAIGNPPPYYSLDEIQTYAHDIEKSDKIPSLKAGLDFGQAIGNGAGNLVTLASQLASALNDVGMGVFAQVNANDNTKVEVSSTSIEDNTILTIISYSYLLLNGAPPFTIEDVNGNTLYNPADNNTSVGTLIGKSNNVKPISSF